MEYNYQARTKTGEIQSGVIEASSKEVAVSILQKYGLYVTFLEESEKTPFFAKKIKFFEKVSLKDLVLFFRQLSIMFAAEISIVESLKTLARQTKNLNFQEKIFRIYNDVEGGSSFSTAISRYPQIFSSFYVAIVRSGEASGKLSESLSYLANHLEREYHLISRLRGVMVYPTLVFFVVLIVLSLMIFFVIPQISLVLKETQQELPTITKILMTLADFLKKWGLIFISIIFILIIALLKYYQTKTGRESFDKNSLKFPMIGSFLKLVYLSRFAENLSTLISSGLPIAQSLEISAKIVGNTVYQKIIFQARDEVRRGEQISSVLTRFPEAFPPVFTQMIQIGETTGTLDKTLMHLVNFYQKETERAVENFLSILEPLLIVFLGAVVGGLIVAFLIPIYQTIGTF